MDRRYKICGFSDVGLETEMRLTLIITSLIFFALLTYARLMALAHAPAGSPSWRDGGGYSPYHLPVFVQQSN